MKAASILSRDDGSVYHSSCDLSDEDLLFYFSDVDLESDLVPLKDLMLFFKIKSVDQLSNLSSYEEYRKNYLKIENIFKTFYNLRYKELYETWDHVPRFVLQSFQDSTHSLINEYISIINSQISSNDMSNIITYFAFQFPKLRNYLKYQITTTQGCADIHLEYSENFRFKSANDSLNLFTLKKDKRNLVIPQNGNSFIYAADYKQFEFRTYLKLIGQQHLLTNENLYENIGQQMGMNASDAKLKIISNLYRDKVDRESVSNFLNRKSVIQNIQNNIFYLNDVPVYVDSESHEGKKIHTINQTISQFFYVQKLKNVLQLLKNKKSKFIFPLHDMMIFSIDMQEDFLIDDIKNILQTDGYCVKEYVGKDFSKLEEL